MTTTLARRRLARDDIARAFKSRQHAWVLHYACQGFDTSDRRITGVAARNLGDGATRSFSIDTELRRIGVDPALATPGELDRAERSLLFAFYEFVSRNLNGVFWLHWNMRNATFGFLALENRFRLLGGTPVEVPESQRIDLAARMIDLYGDDYAAPENRLRALAERNRLVLRDLLDGADQAQALIHHDYAKVDRSLLVRIDLIYAVAIKANEGTLKTDAGPFDHLGGLAGVIPWLKEHPVVLACTIIAPVSGAVFGVAKLWGLLTGSGV